MKSRRFALEIDLESGANSSTPTIQDFDDFDFIDSVCWVGQTNTSLYVELRTHDGKQTFLDSVPVEFFKLGAGREELELNQKVTNNQIRVVLSHDGSEAIKGSLVFNCSRDV